MGIYYFDANVVGRSSGRSSVGAAAYRSGERLQSVAHSSYQSGEKLYDIGDNVVHDYTRKGGVAHSEILLPKDAPKEYADRETLWNVVERRERRRDAQLAREFIVALPREFDLNERIEVMREYIAENFVDKGMIADFAIHDKGDGNPHSHIMLTMRDVTPQGFGKKNTDWNKKDVFLGWRKGWADANNRMFERKGLEERIDHRSYREQGIDREPTIHMGHAATALERQGIRTEKGDINREIQKRNDDRAALKTAQDNTAPDKITKETTTRNEDLDGYIQTEKTALIIERMKQERQRIKVNDTKNQSAPETTTPYITEFEERLKSEKAIQLVEKTRQDPRPAAQTDETALRLHELKETYAALEKEKGGIISQGNEARQEIYPLTYRAEIIDIHNRTMGLLQDKVDELQELRQSLGVWDRAQKKKLDESINYAQQNVRQKHDEFRKRYQLDPAEAQTELKRLQEVIRIKERDIALKKIRRDEITAQQDAIRLEYHTQKLLNDIRPDKEQIEALLEQMRAPPESVLERLQYERVERRLNVLAGEDFQKVIDNLPYTQAQILTNIREQAKERERLIETERERTQEFERSR